MKTEASTLSSRHAVRIPESGIQALGLGVKYMPRVTIKKMDAVLFEITVFDALGIKSRLRKLANDKWQKFSPHYQSWESCQDPLVIALLEHLCEQEESNG